MSGLISSTYLSLAKAITPAGSFFLFAGVSLLSVVFVIFVLPETSGRTLEEIEAGAQKEYTVHDSRRDYSVPNSTKDYRDSSRIETPF